MTHSKHRIVWYSSLPQKKTHSCHRLWWWQGNNELIATSNAAAVGLIHGSRTVSWGRLSQVRVYKNNTRLLILLIKNVQTGRPNDHSSGIGQLPAIYQTIAITPPVCIYVLFGDLNITLGPEQSVQVVSDCREKTMWKRGRLQLHWVAD